MDLQTELAFWFVVSVCLVGPVVTFFRLRSVPPGWCVVWATVLAVAVAGRLRGSVATVLMALALWIVLVAVPTAVGPGARRA
jgi:hypothetical protein